MIVCRRHLFFGGVFFQSPSPTWFAEEGESCWAGIGSRPDRPGRRVSIQRSESRTSNFAPGIDILGGKWGGGQTSGRFSRGGSRARPPLPDAVRLDDTDTQHVLRTRAREGRGGRKERGKGFSSVVHSLPAISPTHTHGAQHTQGRSHAGWTLSRVTSRYWGICPCASGVTMEIRTCVQDSKTW